MKNNLKFIVVAAVFGWIGFLESCKSNDPGPQNNAPEISNQAFSIDENSANGTVVGQVVASDPDEGQILTYSVISGNEDGVFELNDLTGALTVADAIILDFEDASSHVLKIEIADDFKKSKIAQADITISVIDINEVHSIQNQSFSIDENSVNGLVLGIVEISDPENGAFTYEVSSGDDLSVFAIDNTGEVTVAEECLLDYERTASFNLTVQVSDEDFSESATITIDLNNLNDPSSVTTIGLIGYYPFNGNGNDESVNSNDGDVQGPSLVVDRNGCPNSAYSFDGVDDYIVIPHSDNYNFGVGDDYSISFWIKVPATQNDLSSTASSIITKEGTANPVVGYPFAVRLANSMNENTGLWNTVYTRRWDTSTCGNTSTSIDEHVSSTNAIGNTWSNVTIVKSNSNIYLYLDNQLEGSGVDSSTMGCSTTNNYSMFIGKRDGNKRIFTGELDDLRFYDRALSSSEIATVFNEN